MLTEPCLPDLSQFHTLISTVIRYLYSVVYLFQCYVFYSLQTSDPQIKWDSAPIPYHPNLYLVSVHFVCVLLLLLLLLILLLFYCARDGKRSRII